jgi:NAD(P)-dependent dehydrogenase (short-subunit alcohol dehydrogenase family)
MRKTVLITGGNSGIGLATACEFAARDLVVCLACRDPLKGAKARARILEELPWAQVEIFRLDLSSFTSIRQFVQAFERQHGALDILVNNAATVPLKLQLTQDGFEMQFGVNYLGHFLLTHLLMPSLGNGVEQGGESRIVHVSSLMHMLGRIDERTFQGEGLHKPGVAYAQSKLANVLFSNALARRLPQGISSQAMHPGRVASQIWREVPRPLYALIWPFLSTPDRGAKLIADMATLRGYARRTGTYESAQWPAMVSRAARNMALQERLYHRSCELVGVEALGLDSATARPMRGARRGGTK